MSLKRISILTLTLFACGTSLEAVALDVQVQATRSGANAAIDQHLKDGKALVTVTDAREEPVLGLEVKDFAVTRSGKPAKVLSVQPLTATVEVPRHLVLVLDNSFSMQERQAVDPLLNGIRTALKTVRPIDDVWMVVFRDERKVKLGGRDLHVQTFRSNDPLALATFAEGAYRKGFITANTVLYEAMLAGLELVRDMPPDEPRFLVVFSDGQDLNSAYKRDEVSRTAEGLQSGYYTFAIDFMPSPELDPFLVKFTKENGGTARKARRGADLLALFQQASSVLDHYYVVSYEVPPPPPPPEPAKPRPATFDAAVLFDFNKAELKPAGKDELKAYGEQAKAEMSAATQVKITGHTCNMGPSDYNQDLSLRRAEAVRDYLVGLGADPGKLDVSGAGMTQPIADNGTREGRLKNRRVEIEVLGFAK